MANNNQNLEQKIETQDQKKMPDDIYFVKDYAENKIYGNNRNDYNNEVLIPITSNNKNYDHLLW